jgi:hypothetical protein
MKKIWITTILFFLIVAGGWFALIKFGKKYISPHEVAQIATSPIKHSETHIQYWSKNGKDLLLLGGSDEDNLFQMGNVEQHLDLLQSAGGNYVRNTMSSRDVGNEWPYEKNQDSIYDLNSWNKKYWEKFDNFLSACEGREIIVQMELWATFDFYRENWDVNPFNPKNNMNYTTQRSHLPEVVISHPTWTENNFFRTVPSQESNLIVLGYQQKFIDKILSYSLNYGNVLYCMDNETSVTSEWGKFWSFYIKHRAAEKGLQIYTTEMWDPWDLDHAAHRETLDHPEIYDFADISQNNHNSGDTHWENGISQITRLEQHGMLRPLNNVKVYGNDGGRHQTTQNAIESFVRNVLFGAASTRFHRPTSGQGLNDTARAVISSMKSYFEKSDFFNGRPANELLLDRQKNEAYCRAIAGSEYAIYFPQDGEIELDINKNLKDISVEWLDILHSEWKIYPQINRNGDKLLIKSPGGTNWLALIKIK